MRELFDFISSTNPNEADTFFHVNNIEGNWHPQVGMFVSFEAAISSRNGKPEALSVKLLPKEEAEKERAWASADEPVRMGDSL